MFEGPLHKQIRDALSFIKTNVIVEHVMKVDGQAEALRFYNYPFQAIEEVLVNAVYHKSYELGSPIEIQIFLDHMTILSYPSPVPPVNAKILSTHHRIIAREYRNRRIGDFLKELKLTEGRGTGVPAIYKAMSANGSDVPSFETDESTYVLVTLPAHNPELSNQASNQVNNLYFSNLEDVIAYCSIESNQVSNQASIRAKNLLDIEIHDKVYDILVGFL